MDQQNPLPTHIRRNPRRDSVEALIRILHKGESSTEVLNDILPAYGIGQSRDAALMHAITMGVLRNLLLLQALVEAVSDRPLKAIDQRVLLVIYTGILQLVFMDRIPAHAAVDETVKRVKAFNRKAVPFVNAVMRSVSRQHDQLLDGIVLRTTRFSLPEQLLSAMETLAGRRLTGEELGRLNSPSPTVLRVNQALIDREKLMAKLATNGIRTRIADHARSALILTDGALSLADTGAVPRLIVPQDLGSQLVVDLLDPQPGERILDLCAGRGIKTTQIQEYTRSGALVTAVDISGDKLRSLQTLANRKGLQNISVVQGDATVFKSATPFDRVLLDAPCTGSGTLRRRPEVRYRLQGTDMEKMTNLQRRLLTSAVRLVRPGGIIVYAVCSILPEEGPKVWDSLMKDSADFRELDLSEHFGDVPFLTPEGQVLTLPYRDETDGFFIAAARKIKKEGGTATSVHR